MRILLINPGIYDHDGKIIKQKRIWLPGLTLPHLAALMPGDIDVRIVDEVTEDIPLHQDWDLVGISSIGSGIIRTWELGDYFKSRNIPVIIGGIAATLGGFEKNKSHCDGLLLGEAENVLVQLINDVRNKRIQPLYNGTQSDLKHLPVPRYDLLDKKRIGFWMPVQAARGCKNTCNFCSVASFYQSTYRMRPVDEIIRDVEAIKGLGFNKITIIDDNIGINTTYLSDLCKALIPLKIHWMSQCAINIAEHDDVLDLMALSGCTMLSIGLESVNQESLNNVRKGINRVSHYPRNIKKIREHGIDVSTEMMIGIDTDTDSIFGEMYNFIIKNHISVPRVYVITPIPGTPLFEKWDKEKRIFDYNHAHYNGARLVFYPRKMNHLRLEKEFWKLYKKLYRLPVIFRRFLMSRPTRGILENIFSLGANFHYRKHIKHKIPPGIV
ncbi:MAG: B12-binding domain-containing radical SAM protein [Spirochaetales bacterium]|nr:B12-binding domain-containing radical SAM protein [Spirochaetales bacterium]